MKKLFLIPFLFITMSLMSGQSAGGKKQVRDSLPPVRHIDSIIVYSDNSYPPEKIFNTIGDLRRHIDSLNHSSTLYHKELALASMRRDSTTHAMIQVTIERDRLKDENESQKSVLDVVTKFPDYLMLLAIVIAGSLIGQGVRNWYVIWKKDA